MSEFDLSSYEPMWTTQRDSYALWEVGEGCYLPVRTGDRPMLWPICNEELADLVVARMLEAGLPVIAESDW
ncbi:hypothetical protein [Kitasatospora sp. DSM 101779]|uniref:hypothetical protein n=1 Tax=Kitasatospora sp. DSM 101779 TaxID=2853165 RepID=UPI0021DACB4E|nr:hypothetical protein [Kitasatospora sp. DSM 101779]MCU7825128.1 hypothetical protein [Kitasatospora sp. DSM 101779]